MRAPYSSAILLKRIVFLVAGVNLASLNAVVPARGNWSAFRGGGWARPFHERNGELPARLQMKSGLDVMAVSKIVIPDEISRGFEVEVEISAEENVPSHGGHIENWKDEHGIPSFVIIAVPAPIPIDQLQPAPSGNGFPQGAVPIGSRNRH